MAILKLSTNNHATFASFIWGGLASAPYDLRLVTEVRGPTEDIIHYFTLMSSELHYLDIIPKIEKFTLMSSTL